MGSEAAIFSRCGLYRYTLTRDFDDLLQGDDTAYFLMLNPSTADARFDDPTIRRCKGFAQRFGCRRLRVLNLYAYRATDPAQLWSVPDPVGPLNDAHLSTELANRGVICAWGSNAERERVESVVELLVRVRARLWCLGTNKDGMPKHPLYVPGATELRPWKLPG